MENIQEQPVKGPAISSNVFLLLVAAFPLVFAAALTILIKGVVPFSKIGADMEYASIKSPAQNRSIQRNFRASGSIKQSLDPLHLFVVESSPDGIFPKAPISSTAGPWSVDLYSGAPANVEFRLVVVSVNDEDKDKFFAWFKTGETTGKYPGIKEVASLQELSAVSIRVGGE